MGLAQSKDTFISNHFIAGPLWCEWPSNDSFPIGTRFHYVWVTGVSPAVTNGAKLYYISRKRSSLTLSTQKELFCEQSALVFT